MSTGKPITPQEAKAAATDSIPSEVFDAFNELLTAQGHASVITVKQDEVVALIVQKITATKDWHASAVRNKIFDLGWLDVEAAYGKAGWKVTYDKPAYNETYPATFTFKAKRSK